MRILQITNLKVRFSYRLCIKDLPLPPLGSRDASNVASAAITEIANVALAKNRVAEPKAGVALPFPAVAPRQFPVAPRPPPPLARTSHLSTQ